MSPIFIFAAAVALVGFVLLVVFFGFLAVRPKKNLAAFTSEGGQVFVSRKAAQELIQECCQDLDQVARAKARVSIRKGALHTRVDLKVRRDSRLKDVTGYLQERIARVLRENLNLENVGEIEIQVTGILPGGPSQDRAFSVVPPKDRTVSAADSPENGEAIRPPRVD
ncbi:MAG: hypothetical protein EA425_06710 [Puniceicoccaceae bacterium]|nr:MAG: hypothetical protein EA425_06710 [Puniceicoccaceae bacterium]